MDWVVLRNRMATLDARNKRRVAAALDELAPRIGFRLVPGFSERVVFRELFLSGLTLLDLRDTDPQAMTMSNIAARQEVRDLLRALDLPAVSAAAWKWPGRDVRRGKDEGCVARGRLRRGERKASAIPLPPCVVRSGAEELTW